MYDIYIRGYSIRIQSNPITPEGYAFDRKKLTELYRIRRDNAGKGYGLVLQKIADFQDALDDSKLTSEKQKVRRQELNKELRSVAFEVQEIENAFSVLVNEIDGYRKKINEDEDFISLCTKEIDKLNEAISKDNLMYYKALAHETYSAVYDSLSPDSQSYLDTSLVLEERISAKYPKASIQRLKVLGTKLKNVASRRNDAAHGGNYLTYDDVCADKGHVYNISVEEFKGLILELLDIIL